jgi:hypothetical protein
MDSFELKCLVAHFLRYDLTCPVIGLEVSSSLASTYNDGGAADVLAVNKNRYIIEVEVKISLADMRADRKKAKHEYYRKLCGMTYNTKHKRFGQIVEIEPEEYPTHWFYFAVPHELFNDAKILCENIYPYAGLLTDVTTSWSDGTKTTDAKVRREARTLNHRKITLAEAIRLARGQSATVVRLMKEIARKQ